MMGSKKVSSGNHCGPERPLLTEKAQPGERSGCRPGGLVTATHKCVFAGHSSHLFFNFLEKKLAEAENAAYRPTDRSTLSAIALAIVKLSFAAAALPLAISRRPFSSVAFIRAIEANVSAFSV